MPDQRVWIQYVDDDGKDADIVIVPLDLGFVDGEWWLGFQDETGEQVRSLAMVDLRAWETVHDSP
jgi:hypothetical protein